jgi:hypothetical protein
MEYTLNEFLDMLLRLGAADNNVEADFKSTCNLYCHGNGTKLQF